MLLAVTVLSVIQREEGLEGSDVVSGGGLFVGVSLSPGAAGETSSTS